MINSLYWRNEVQFVLEVSGDRPWHKKPWLERHHTLHELTGDTRYIVVMTRKMTTETIAHARMHHFLRFAFRRAVTLSSDSRRTNDCVEADAYALSVAW